MVGVAKMVIAPGCGPGGRGFESHHSPHRKRQAYACRFFIIQKRNGLVLGVSVYIDKILGLCYYFYEELKIHTGR